MQGLSFFLYKMKHVMIVKKNVFLPGASNADAEGALLNELYDELGAPE